MRAEMFEDPPMRGPGLCYVTRHVRLPAPWNKQLTSEGLTSQSEVSESGSRSPWLPVLLQVSYTAAVSVTSDGVCRHYIQYTLKEGLHSYTGGNRELWTSSWLLLSSPIDLTICFRYITTKWSPVTCSESEKSSSELSPVVALRQQYTRYRSTLPSSLQSSTVIIQSTTNERRFNSYRKTSLRHQSVFSKFILKSQSARVSTYEFVVN